MSALKSTMNVVNCNEISDRLLESKCENFGGGLITTGQYAWLVSGANLVLYSQQLRLIISSRSFSCNQKDKSLKVQKKKNKKY